jgi:hypothetical protein
MFVSRTEYDLLEPSRVAFVDLDRVSTERKKRERALLSHGHRMVPDSVLVTNASVLRLDMNYLPHSPWSGEVQDNAIPLENKIFEFCDQPASRCRDSVSIFQREESEEQTLLIRHNYRYLYSYRPSINTPSYVTLTRCLHPLRWSPPRHLCFV